MKNLSPCFLCGALLGLAAGWAHAAASAHTEPGLIGIVFDNPALAKPVRVWTVAEPRTELLAPIARHDFSLALRGRLSPPAAGEWEIKAEVEVNDGLRLRVDGVTVIDGWATDGPRLGRVRIEAGAAVSCELDYHHDGGPANLRLRWRPVGKTEWAAVPATAFAYTAEDRAAMETQFAALMRAFEQPVVAVANPQPDRWPTLRFLRQGVRPLLRISFPDTPGFACDAYLYESDVDLLEARDAGEGQMEVRHRVLAPPGLVVVSTVRPEPGAIEVEARLVREDGSAADLPAGFAPLNLCLQLRLAPTFASYPEPYAWFARRCFVFTEKGRTFLDRTARVPTPRFSADDPVNNPPWTQAYLPAWGRREVALPFPWIGVSPDRITATTAGVVSRDGRHLVALANDSATSISQVWIDCLHNNPEWQRAEKPGAAPTWRMKIYLMENDPRALLRRVVRDFPAADRQPAVQAALAAGAEP